MRHHARRGAELRIVTGSGDLHFLDGILIRHNDLKSTEAIGGVGDSINFIFAIAKELAIHQRAIELRRVFTGPNLKEVLNHSGSEIVQFAEIPTRSG